MKFWILCHISTWVCLCRWVYLWAPTYIPTFTHIHLRLPSFPLTTLWCRLLSSSFFRLLIGSGRVRRSTIPLSGADLTLHQCFDVPRGAWECCPSSSHWMKRNSDSAIVFLMPQDMAALKACSSSFWVSLGTRGDNLIFFILPPSPWQPLPAHGQNFRTKWIKLFGKYIMCWEEWLTLFF